MASDMPPGQEYQPGNNFGVSLSGDDEAQLTGWWDALAEGGTVMVPLEKQAWGDCLRHVPRPLRHHLAGQHRRRAGELSRR